MSRRVNQLKPKSFYICKSHSAVDSFYGSECVIWYCLGWFGLVWAGLGCFGWFEPFGQFIVHESLVLFMIILSGI